MYLAGLNIKMGSLLSLKIVIGKNSSSSTGYEHHRSERDCRLDGEIPCVQENLTLPDKGEGLHIYDNKGSNLYMEKAYGSKLKIYI